jgi:hypothetical protein
LPAPIFNVSPELTTHLSTVKSVQFILVFVLTKKLFPSCLPLAHETNGKNIGNVNSGVKNKIFFFIA